MLFNSYEFWIFFVGVFLLYRMLHHRAQNVLLLVASAIFYGWWDWRFLLLLMFSTVLDYASGVGIEKCQTARAKKTLLVVSIFANLAFLGFFKYYGFFTHELMGALDRVGIHASIWTLDLILPVGLSFYTFNSMSYVIDVYRGIVKAEPDLLTYSVYVAYFPHMVAGPIQRATCLLPQIAKPRTLRADDFVEGLYHVLIGLFKKIVIADNMATIANSVFLVDAATLTGGEILVGIYAFAFQIYGDFSGYSSIAQGTSKWLGIDLTNNFRVPYLATSPSDFWKRWHISLSTWLRDYLYLPLGGNRHGKWKTYRNLMLTMFLGGLWHGAGWTFIAWGTFHGLVLCLYRPFEKMKPRIPSALISVLAVLLMFHVVCFGWLLFRAQSMTQVYVMLVQMTTNWSMTPFAWHCLIATLFFCGPLLVFEWWLDRNDDLLLLTRKHWLNRGMVYVYCTLMLILFSAETAHEFIYFQF
ncbi:MAG: MBOAT family protein [Planctomycetia bacterium]|nr:MBOAT family protein [Planctomycetia bacterium]